MKACANKRKQIAWLTVDALDAKQAEQLRGHLRTCAGCREYWQELARVSSDYAVMGERLPDIRLSDSFHQRVVSRIRQTDKKPVDEFWLAGFVRHWFADWHRAIPAGALALLLVAALVLPGRHKNAPPASAPPPPIASASTGASTTTDSSFSAYRMTANKSLDALDELLTRQAARNSWPPELLTVSSHTP